jgi:hypothetical protein
MTVNLCEDVKGALREHVLSESNSDQLLRESKNAEVWWDKLPGKRKKKVVSILGLDTNLTRKLFSQIDAEDQSEIEAYFTKHKGRVESIELDERVDPIQKFASKHVKKWAKKIGVKKPRVRGFSTKGTHVELYSPDEPIPVEARKKLVVYIGGQPNQTVYGNVQEYFITLTAEKWLDFLGISFEEDINLNESIMGQYWGRRAKDSRIIRMKDSEAKAVIKRQASKKAPDDWLLVWWVPPEYVSVKEGKWRIEKGWIKPIWDWGKGASGINLTFDSVVHKEDVDFDEGCKTPGMKKRSKGKGRGLAKGKGKGPLGVPVGDKDKDWVKEIAGRLRERIFEARENQIIVAVHVVADKVDEHGIPMNYRAQLYDVAKKAPMHPGLGVKNEITARSGWQALEAVAKNWKQSGFLD